MRRLAELTGLAVRETPNHFHAQATLDAAIAAHGALRTIALSLWKIGSDIRLMGMGPRAGLAEIALPETQPGSSIMPGKVNPVIVESLTMVVARVLGNDTTVAFGQTGSLPRAERDAAGDGGGPPRVDRACLRPRRATVADRAVTGLVATERGPALVEQGLMLATALAPEIGYDAGGCPGEGGVQVRPDDPRAGAGARHRPGPPRRAAGPRVDDRARAGWRPGRRLTGG